MISLLAGQKTPQSYFSELIIYALRPEWLHGLSLPFPAWLRWVGVTLGATSLPLLA